MCVLVKLQGESLPELTCPALPLDPSPTPVEPHFPDSIVVFQKLILRSKNSIVLEYDILFRPSGALMRWHPGGSNGRWL